MDFKLSDEMQYALDEAKKIAIHYKYQSVAIVPALLKMIEEVTQNSIDEHIRTAGAFATDIRITVKSKTGATEISVSDNGRGIPLNTVGDKPRPVLAWTELRAGSNFDDSKRTTAGTNGMGAALTNIFSSSFIGETCDGARKLTLKCSDNMQSVDWKIGSGTTRGTTVTFIPDLTRFGLSEFTADHVTVLHDRLINLAISYPQITFRFNGEKLHFRNIKAVAKQFHPDAVSVESDNYGLVFAPAGADEEFRCITYVNGIYVKNGGSHVDYILNKIIENLRTHIKKRHKIDVLPNQIKQHLLIGAWCRNFNALRFDSQTKERITNSVAEVSAYFGEIDLDKISKQILATPAIIDPMIAAILYKKEMAEKLALAKKQKSATKVRVVNHIAATDPDPENRSLLLTEGMCIEENTQIFTLGGSKPIKNVEIGDYVLTHANKFKRVLSKSFALKSGIRVNGIIYSEQHRLFVYDTVRLKFDFIAVKDLKRGVHKLIHNRAIEVGFFTCIHHVKAIVDDTVITDKDSAVFSKIHEILTIDNDEIVTKTIDQLNIGDVILL